MASRLASFVGTVQLRLKIEQATSTDDDPTPIYLLDEVVQMVGSSNKNISDAVEIIQQRLQHRTATVKQKTLRLVKHIAQRGSPDFRRALARHSSAVRDLTAFRCAPDPFKGDIPWKRVQEYARESLEAIHAGPVNPSDSSTSRMGRIQGFGNDAGGTSSQVGFGSDSLNGGGARTAGSMIGFGGNISPGSGSGVGLQDSVLGTISSGVKDLTDRALGAFTRPQHQRLDSSEGDEFGYSGGDGYNSPRVPIIASELPSPRFVHGTGSTRSTPNALAHDKPGKPPTSVEQQLIERICTPSGLRLAPRSEDLKAFVSAAGAANGTQLAVAFQKKLETGSWQEVLRALCCIEAMLGEGGTAAVSKEMAEHLRSSPGPVRRACQSTQMTVRERAERVVRLLGIDNISHSDVLSKPAVCLLGDNAKDASGAAGNEGGAIDLLAELDTSERVISTHGAYDLLGAVTDDQHCVTLPPTAAAQSVPTPADDLFGAWMEPEPAVERPSDISTYKASTIDISDGLSSLSLGAVARPVKPMTVTPLAHPPPQPSLQAPLQPQTSPGATLGYPTLTVPSLVLPNPASMKPLPGFGMDPVESGGGVLGGPPSFSTAPAHTCGLSYPAGGNVDVSGAMNAAASGIVSANREDAAFNFVQGTMAELKKK